jgi:hypothetical protein
MYTLEMVRDWWQKWTFTHLYPNFYLKKLLYRDKFYSHLAASELLRRYHHRKLLKPIYRQIGAIMETVPDFRKDAGTILLKDNSTRFHLSCVIELVPELREQAARQLLELGNCSPNSWDLIANKVPEVATISRLRQIHKPSTEV